MSLKAIYGKEPLTELYALPLRAGQAKRTDDVSRALDDLAPEAKEHKALWEGVFRMACAVSPKPMQEPVAGWIESALETQEESGVLPMDWVEAVAVMRAAYAMYELDARRPLLEKLLRWCGALAEHWDEAMAEPQLTAHAADLMGLLVSLYRVSGKAAILKLCQRLTRQAMDWSGVLQTFAVQRPASKNMPWSEMENGMAEDGGSADGFYTRQYLSCHAESLADGARYAAASGVFTGSTRSLTAGRNGWEKITRWHGAVCGGVTGDELVEGATPSAAVDAAALGAWMEALCDQGTLKRDSWCWDAVETLMANGIPAALNAGKLIPFQRVNGLAANCATRDCYHVHEGQEQALRALDRLCRGWACGAQHAVTTCKAGADVNLYQAGTYAFRLGQEPVKLVIEGEAGAYTLRLHMTHAVKAALSLRIPNWTDDAFICVNDEGGDEGHPGQWLTLEREWKPGDTITVKFARPIRVQEGHHQSAAVYQGATLMAYPADAEHWAVALYGQPEVRDGHVYAKLCRVPGWRKHGMVPADLPVRPDTEGEPFETELTPYAETPCRIALFPRSAKA